MKAEEFYLSTKCKTTYTDFYHPFLYEGASAALTAIFEFAEQYAEFKIKENEKYLKKIPELSGQILELQSQLKERDNLLKELISDQSGDVQICSLINKLKNK